MGNAMAGTVTDTPGIRFTASAAKAAYLNTPSIRRLRITDAARIHLLWVRCTRRAKT